MTVVPNITVIVPVYNNAGTLIPTYDTIREKVIERFPTYDLNFIFINDGSKDSSWQELLKLKESHPNRVKLINFSRNFGQFAALNAGLHHSLGDYTIGISADQQDPPEIVAEMVEKSVAGADIVLAVRQSRKDSFFKNITAAAHVALIRRSSPDYPKGGFDGWLLNRKAVNAYKQFGDRIRSNQIDILDLGFKVDHIRFDRRKREVGKSQYNFKKRLNVSINQILATSAWPLRMVSYMGFITTIIGFLYGLRVIMIYFTKGTPFVGYAPIILLQLFIGGIIMLMLGIIGEYQWRIYYESKNRPIYIIEEIL